MRRAISTSTLDDISWWAPAARVERTISSAVFAFEAKAKWNGAG